MILKDKLAEKGLNSSSLARLLGVSPSTAWRWIYKNSVPHSVFVPTLAKLGVYDDSRDAVKSVAQVEKDYNFRLRFDPLLAGLKRELDTMTLKADLLDKKLQEAEREVQRLTDLTGRKNPVRCQVCFEVRERSEKTCGNCGHELESLN
jgi:transcriptional regulator with XRE-family HTH domain